MPNVDGSIVCHFDCWTIWSLEVGRAFHQESYEEPSLIRHDWEQGERERPGRYSCWPTISILQRVAHSAASRMVQLWMTVLEQYCTQGILQDEKRSSYHGRPLRRPQKVISQHYRSFSLWPGWDCFWLLVVGISTLTMDLTERWPRWEKTNCFQKLATGLTVPQLPSLSPADFDVVRRQKIQRRGDVFYGISQDVADHELDDVDSLKAEGDSNLDHWPSWEDDGVMRDALESALSMSSAVDIQTEHYIALSPWYRHRRSSLGLAPMALVTNQRMRATRDHIPGLHSSAIHLNLHPSFGLCHKEEVDLQLTSLLWAGAPVVWVVISPIHSAKFEAQLVEHLHLSSQCSQFVRHSQLIVPPSLLDAWEIEYHIFAQLAGEAVRLNYQTYYYQWHLGANLSERINGCERVWGPPPMYRYCQAGDVRCNSRSPITATGMEILATGPRELVEEPDDSLGTSIIVPTIERTNSPGVTSLESGNYSTLFVQQDSASGSTPRGSPAPTVDSVNGVQDVVQPAPGSNYNSFPNIRRAHQGVLRLPASNLGIRKNIRPVSSIQVSSDEGIDDVESDGEDSNPPATPSRVERAPLSPFGPSLSQLEATAAVPSASAIDAFLDSTLQEGNAFGRLTIGSASEGSSATSGNVRSAAVLTPPSTGKSTRNRRIRETINPEMRDLEIDQYIEFGIQNRDNIAWKYILPTEAEEVLARFRPQAWLSTGGVMETLGHLADARPDVHVVNAHSFTTARRTGDLDSIASRWALATTILVPVHLEEKNHWVLVSLDLERHILSIYESSIPCDVEDLFVDYLCDQGTWTLEYADVPANDGHNCGIILLKEAEALLRPETEIPNDFNLLRQRYIRMIVQRPGHQDLPTATPISRAQSSEIPPPANLSSGSVLSDDERETPLSHTELEALACTVGCDKVLDDLEGLMGTLCATPAPGIEQATRLYIYARDNLATEVQERAFVADILRSESPDVELALQIYAKYAKEPGSATADGREVVQANNPQPLVTLFSQGGSLEILGRFQKCLAAIFLARIFEVLVKHFREEKMIEQELQRSIRNHKNYRRRREAQGFKVTKRRKKLDDIEVVSTRSSSTSAEDISPASTLHAESKAYDLLAGIRKPSEEAENREPAEKKGNRETVKAARIFGSQLLAYEAEAGSGWPLWMFIPTIKVPSPANTSYSATWNKFFKLRSADRQLLVGMVRTNNPRLWQALPNFAEHIYGILRGEDIGSELLRALR